MARTSHAVYRLGEWLSRGVRTLYGSMVSIESPDHGPDPNAAIGRVEHYRVEGRPNRVALQDAERPLAWIESDVSISLGVTDGDLKLPDVLSRAPRLPYNDTDK